MNEPSPPPTGQSEQSADNLAVVTAALHKLAAELDKTLTQFGRSLSVVASESQPPPEPPDRQV